MLPQQVIEPDSTAPDTTTPPLERDGDPSTGYGLRVHGRWEPDPLLPDLSQYDQPAAVDVTSAETIQPAPETDYAHDILDQADLDAALDGQPGLGFTRLTVHTGLDASDPLLGVMNHAPTEEHMVPDPRPGDLAPQAVTALHDMDNPDVAAVANKPYNEVYSDASGNNSTRTRHMDLLIRGLQ
jgi:hypothetical protein